MANPMNYDVPVYSAPARAFHWIVAALVLLQLPLGLWMMYRAEEMPGVNDKGEPVKGVWNGIADNGLTDTLFSSHKVIGIVILLLALLRLAYRLTHGAPRSDPSVPRALTGISHAVHWAIYALIILVPIGGYLGISYGNYLDVFGFHLPAITAEDKKVSETILENHGLFAEILLVLVSIHIAAALYHRFIRKDRVVERMLPSKTKTV